MYIFGVLQNFSNSFMWVEEERVEAAAGTDRRLPERQAPVIGTGNLDFLHLPGARFESNFFYTREFCVVVPDPWPQL